MKNKFLLPLFLLFSASTAHAIPMGQTKIEIDLAAGGTDVFQVNALRAQDAGSYYAYDETFGLSYNNRFDRSGYLTTFILRDTNGYNMFFVTDTPKDGTGGTFSMGVNSSLQSSGLDWVVKDDPEDTFLWDDATGTGGVDLEWWACCTDGGVLGAMTEYEDWTVTLDNLLAEGLTKMRLVWLDRQTKEFADHRLLLSDVSAIRFIYNVPEPAPLLVLSLGLLLMGLMNKGGVGFNGRA